MDHFEIWKKIMVADSFETRNEYICCANRHCNISGHALTVM